MDAGPVTVSWPSGHAVSQWLRLSLRLLPSRTDDTLLTFVNGRVTQHPLTRSELALVFRDYW